MRATKIFWVYAIFYFIGFFLYQINFVPSFNTAAAAVVWVAISFLGFLVSFLGACFISIREYNRDKTELELSRQWP